MLKLTNSFCRYFICFVTESKNFNVHVREFTNFSKGKACCTVWYTKSVLLNTVQLLRKNKHSSIRIPTFYSNDSNREAQMSNQLKNNHVCDQDVIEISTDEDTPSGTKKGKSPDYRKENDTNPQSQVIPQDFRVWEVVGSNRTTSNGASFKFKVVSYNVLAQYLLECHPYLYTECSSRNLKWKVRFARIYDEIMKMAPDILCLQEVQASHMSSFYSKFEKVGYFGVYKQKTGHRQDGCAIYFKQSVFELLDHITVEFYQPELPILNRDNIGVMVKLLPRNRLCSPIVVATTHLLYNPNRTDVRLAQIQVLLAELDRFSYYTNGRKSGHHPIILAGDFNSMPDSAVIKLLDRGCVRVSQFRDSSDWKRIGVTDNCQHLSVYLNRQQGRETDYSSIKLYNSDYSPSPPDTESVRMKSPNCEQFGELFNSGKLGYSLNLVSVYNKKYTSNGEKEATTYQNYWVTVDYIYFSCCRSLRLVERLRLPTVSECVVLGNLPNDVYGSDHLILAALFELQPYKTSF